MGGRGQLRQRDPLGARLKRSEVLRPVIESVADDENEQPGLVRGEFGAEARQRVEDRQHLDQRVSPALPADRGHLAVAEPPSDHLAGPCGVGHQVACLPYAAIGATARRQRLGPVGRRKHR
jgi:hypothetical protein